MAPDLRDSPHPFGLSDPALAERAPDEQTLTLLERSGAGFVRFGFEWHPGAPAAQTIADQEVWVDSLLRRSIRISGLLGPSPQRPPSELPDPAAFATFCSRTVARYRDRIRHWEIWHEPDDEAFWPVQDDMASYAALLRRAAEAAKDADPSGLIHVGGLAKRLPRSLEQLYGHGGAFDIVNIHPFINPLMPDALGALRYFYDRIRRVMARHGDSQKPVWFGQIACPGLREAGAAAWHLGKVPSELHQSAWVRTLFDVAIRWPGVEKIFWAGWQDRADSVSRAYGLLRPDGSRKPAFEQFQDKALSAR